MTSIIYISVILISAFVKILKIKLLKCEFGNKTSRLVSLTLLHFYYYFFFFFFGGEGHGWVDLAQGRDRCQALVKVVVDFQAS
jgi:hypothetical protein